MIMVSLKRLIPILTVTPLIATLGLTGLLGIYSEQKTVYDLSSHWLRGTVSQISDQIQSNLEKPAVINHINLQGFQDRELDGNNPEMLGIHFTNQMNLFALVNNIYFGDRTQRFVGSKLNENGQITQSYAGEDTNYQLITYGTNSEGKRTIVLRKTSGFDPQSRLWYQAAKNKNNLVWSPVYPDFMSRQLAITAAQAVRENLDHSGELVGVLGVDYFLSELQEYLRDLSISKVGKAMIIQEDGRLIATSNPDPETVLDPTSETHFFITQTPDPIMGEIGEKLIDQFSDFSLITQDKYLSFIIQGKKHWVWVKPFENSWGLKWLIIVSLAESDRFTLTQNARQLILGIGAIAIGVTFLGILTIYRLLISPLLRLNIAAKKVKNRQFKPKQIADLIQRNDEIGKFSRVFQEMALVIQERQANLEQRIHSFNNTKAYSSGEKPGIETQKSDNVSTVNLNYWDYLKNKSEQIRQKGNPENDRDQTPPY